MKHSSNRKIYKIIGNVENSLIYIGSSKMPYLSNRIGMHRVMYRKWKNGLSPYCTVYKLFDLYGLDNCKIILIETCKDDATVDESRQREQHFIDNHVCVNKNKAFVEDKKERVKEWCLEHKEKLQEYRSKYYKEYNSKQREAKAEPIE